MSCTVLLATLLALVTPKVEVRAVDSPPIVGSLVELDGQRVAVETPEGRRTVPIDRLLRVTAQGATRTLPSPGDVWIQLVDGCELVADGILITGEEAELLGPGPPRSVATRDLRAVRLVAADEALAKQWARLLGEPASSDRLVVRRDGLLDYHRGILGDATAERIKFSIDGDVLSINRAKVFGLIYARPAGRAMPKAVCRLLDAAGNRWNVAELDWGSAGLTLTTPAGLSVTLAPEAIGRLDFSEGKVVWLGDLAPPAVRYTPYFGSPEESASRARLFAPRQDRGLAPGPLRLDGRSYTKGLSLHSRSEVEYVLPGPFGSFEATVGIDDAVRPRGDVRLVLTGDGRELFSASIKGTEPARAIRVDVTGVRRLTILVDFGDDLDVGDHLNLCNARIVK